MEKQLEPVVQLLAKNKWPFRLHATYDESISRALDVYEKVNKETPINNLNWFFDHAETISDHSIERVKKLNGGIAIQNRMAFQGEYFINRYGKEAALRTPPIKKLLEAGIPVGMGTDATRVSSYNPWICLYWLTTGKTMGGTPMYDENNIVSREKAIELYTKGSAWFSNEENKKGSFVENQLADFTVLSQDFFTIQDEEIKNTYSILTVVGGEIVHASDEFDKFNPSLPPISPDWSPIRYYGTYGRNKSITQESYYTVICSQHQHNSYMPTFHYQLGCFCFAF